MPALPPGMVAMDNSLFKNAAQGSKKPVARELQEEQEKATKQEKPAPASKAAKGPTAAQLKMMEKVNEQAQDEKERPERETLIRKIQGYMRKFPEKLGHIAVPRDLTGAPLAQLRIIHSEILATLGRSSGEALCTFALLEGMKFGERLHHNWNPLGYNLNGLAAAAQAEMPVTFKPLIEEFVVKHDEWFTSSVEMRIIQAVVGLVLSVNHANSQAVRDFQARAATAPSSGDLQEKLKTL